ncbi:MAG: aminotransferase class IV [Ekhidna sp.]|nr:aminotransferase class IV [Ekhidna sp.]MBC6410730.1 aminotransferase class IV [Ekhidna sp.]MBC6425048.1 aminotransferase class IV [Ekhidna sp.]
MRFIESILFVNGKYHNLDLHQKRMVQTFDRFMPGASSHQLEDILPKFALDGRYKVRVVYDADYDIEVSAYHPKKITSLKVIESGHFDYSYKFENRSHINELLNQSKADDIIISIDGQVTDSSYSNLVFWDGRDWFTPDTPLLNGVKRQQLLKEKRIKEASISVNDLQTFQKVSLINAMLDPGEVEIQFSVVDSFT